ncbi:MAG: radical SAM protein [Candidatus Omnitrophota bacterium]|jgi:radical SAM superfamily enzyme YgiQ (UPF0313 family)
MKKVVLIYPRVLDNIEEKTFLPLSLLSIAALLKNVEVKIIDQRINKDWEKDLIGSLDKDVVCVGITSMTGPQLKQAIDISETVKKTISAPVIWGGVHASLLPEQTLANEFVDIVVIDEGDITFPELVNCLIDKKELDSVNGIAYKKNGAVIFTAPREPLSMEALPEIPYHFIGDITPYIGVNDETIYKRTLPIQTSRGCPYRCAFCYNTTFNKKKWKAKDSRRVIKEINELVEKYNINGVFLIDDNFFADLKRVKEIFAKIKDMSIVLHNLTCRIDTFFRFDDELIGLMREVGVQSIYLGVESGSPAVLKRLNKDINIEQVLISSDKFRNTSIKPVYSFMIGFPFETENDIRKTFKLIYLLKKRNKSAVFGLNIFNPYPSNIMKECTGKGFISPEKTEGWANDWRHIKLPWISQRQMDRFKKAAFSVDLLYDPSVFKSAGKRLLTSLLLNLSLFRIKHNFFSLYFEERSLRFFKDLKRTCSKQAKP